MSAEHWYLLPVGFGIAVLAMSSGVSAGNFWVPVYLLWARFEPPLAFWMTLATMLGGYGSGVVRNLRQGTINRRCLAQSLPYTLPAAVVGAYLAPLLNVTWLILLFGVFVLAYGVRIFVQGARRTDRPSAPFSPWGGRVKATRRTDVVDRGMDLLGGFSLGLITVGLGELLLPRLLVERKALSPAEAVGTTVLVIFVTSLAAALARLNGPFLLALNEQRSVLLNAMLFAGPGVILGGQLGPRLARHFDARTLRRYMAIALWLVGVLLLVRFVVVAALHG
jgi:uncharacterized membrane protein YfcA